MKDLRPMSWKVRPIMALVVIGVSFIGARSSFQHRGINPAMVAFSSDGLVNSLVLNSGYSVIYAAQQFKDEENPLKYMAKWIRMKCYAS
ncbi:phosphoglycerol transferase [Rodentibacter pneumotropicus]|uniref:Phosphoglycerol transferase n=1 Tax=Rodentibacter pneumotropicus TaxID=758 RepID=A0A448MQL7_9PAST|nr:phosphoglycerol transferase [Rodentibacter pneumotropicus]